jgi:putative SOS response-associated peptidase YedK
MKWGLVPHWAKDAAGGARAINARAETIETKPSFRGPFRHHRNLIIADGYFEWRPSADGKVPMRITRADGRPFAFAGVFDRWKPPDDADELLSCAVVTTDAWGRFAWIHDRAPVILEPSSYASWLDPSTSLAALRELLEPRDPEDFIAYPVSRGINSVRNDGPSLVERCEPEQRPQASLF